MRAARIETSSCGVIGSDGGPARPGARGRCTSPGSCTRRPDRPGSPPCPSGLRRCSNTRVPDAFITAAVRTPIGRAGGVLAEVRPPPWCAPSGGPAVATFRPRCASGWDRESRWWWRIRRAGD